MSLTMTALLWIAIILCLALGVVGLVSPVFPGLPLLFAAVWLFAAADDYRYIGPGSLVFYGIVAGIGVLLDFVAGLLGAKYGGAGKKALWGAFFGGVVGIFFGLVGLIFFPVFGAMIGEFLDFATTRKATKVGLGTFMGYVAGMVVKFLFALVIVGGAMIQYFTNVLAG